MPSVVQASRPVDFPFTAWLIALVLLFHNGKIELITDPLHFADFMFDRKLATIPLTEVLWGIAAAYNAFIRTMRLLSIYCLYRWVFNRRRLVYAMYASFFGFICTNIALGFVADYSKLIYDANSLSYSLTQSQLLSTFFWFYRMDVLFTSLSILFVLTYIGATTFVR